MNAAAAPRVLVPACDRCGQATDVEELIPDELGPVCPDCWRGGREQANADA